MMKIIHNILKEERVQRRFHDQRQQFTEQVGDGRAWPRQQVDQDGRVEYVDPPQGGYTLGDHDLPVASRRLELANYFERQANGEIPLGIIVGETGSGKTSNVPLAALETGHFSKIYVGEPRVVLARETMLRLRHNVVQQLGEKAANLIGYATGTERDLHPDNQVIVGTYRLIRHRIEDASDGELEDTKLFVDEYHVREIEGDLLVEQGKLRGVPVTAVSATIDAERTARFHCGNDGVTPAPIIHIKGRQYPIHEMNMDDSTSAAVWALQRGYDTLYPLPGKTEIQSEMGRVAARQKHLALPLHAELSAEEQRRAFEPSSGMPKAIYATEIGGTGITPGVQAVVVPGIGRAMKLINGIPVLGYERLSQARIKQYSGRTGRTGEGYVIRAPLANGPIDLPPNHAEYDTPEIQRVRLDSTVLSLARTGMTLSDDIVAIENLKRLRPLDEPKQQEVYRAQERLRRLGALGVNLTITEIGRDMARLPLDPQFSRMVVASREAGEDIHKYMIAIAAVAQVNGVAVTSSEDGEYVGNFSKETKADLIRFLDIYLGAKQLAPHIYQDHGILPQRVERVDDLIRELCSRENVEAWEEMLPPDTKQRELLRSCMMTAIDELYVRSNMSGRYTDIVRGGERILPRESAIGSAPLVAASPWGLETYRENGPIRRLDFIKNALEVDIETLLRAAPERCDLVEGDYELAENGEIVVCKEVFFDGHSTGQIVRRPIEGMTPELRKFAIHGIFREQLGDESILPIEVQEFRHEIRELWKLHHRSMTDLGVGELIDDIQDDLNSRIPSDVQSVDEILAYIDSNFVRGFLTNEQRRAIYEASPDKIRYISMNEERQFVKVSYKDHAAILHCHDHSELRALPEYITELDGRRIFVQFGDSESLHDFYESKAVYSRTRRTRRGGEGIDVAHRFGENKKSTRLPGRSDTGVSSVPQRYSSRVYK